MKHTLVLRTVAADMTSRGGFVWPRKGTVECPDWDPTPECGQGLHGLAWGTGVATLIDAPGDRVWLVVKVLTADLVDLNGKVKFPRGTVVHCGDQASATQYVAKRAPLGTAVHWLMAQGGDWSTLSGGYRSTLTGGYGSTLTGGDWSTLTGGYGSTLTGGDRSTLTGGYGSTLSGGYGSTLTGGDRSTLTGGDRSTLTGGDWSTLSVRHWDGTRYRIATAYVGEDGIKANVAYWLDGRGTFVRAS